MTPGPASHFAVVINALKFIRLILSCTLYFLLHANGNGLPRNFGFWLRTIKFLTKYILFSIKALHDRTCLSNWPFQVNKLETIGNDNLVNNYVINSLSCLDSLAD